MKIETYESRELVIAAYSKLKPVLGYEDECKKESQKLQERVGESFQRCDTDGCVSQFCDNLLSLKESRKHELKMHDDKFYFPALISIETGELISTKIIRQINPWSHQEEQKWLTKDRQYWSMYKRESSYTKKGVKKVWIIAPAIIGSRSKFDRTPEPRGFGGLTSVNYSSYIDYDNFCNI